MVGGGFCICFDTSAGPEPNYRAGVCACRRFGEPNTQRGLSKWLQGHVQSHGNFGSAVASLTRFFKVRCARCRGTQSLGARQSKSKRRDRPSSALRAAHGTKHQGAGRCGVVRLNLRAPCANPKRVQEKADFKAPAPAPKQPGSAFQVGPLGALWLGRWGPWGR